MQRTWLSLALVLWCSISWGADVRMTKEWLASRAPPYVLSEADSTYILETDVSVDGTAFVFGAANIKLDMGGHTITYGNSPAIVVPDGGFEDGLTSWTVSMIPVRVPARVGMWGKWALRLLEVTAPQRLTSSAVTLPAVGREYAATITPKVTADVQAPAAAVTISVVDQVTGAVLGVGRSKDSERGFAAVATFISTANPVLLQVDIVPPSGVAITVDLDYAAVFPSGDFGIIASTSATNLPPHLKTPAVLRALRLCSNPKIVNGFIRQGTGRGYAGAAISARAVNRFEMANVTAFVNGMDCMNVSAANAQNVTINGCTCDADIDNISNRKDVFGAVHLANNRGDVTVSHCQFFRCPQSGVVVSNNSEGKVTLFGNEISHRGIVSNAYGIVLNGVTDCTVSGNTIKTSSGRGIVLDSWDSANSSNVLIQNNEVDCRVQPNLEYGPGFFEAVAFRMRNYNGAHRRIIVRDNSFTARCGDGDGYVATPLRIAQKNSLGQMNAAGNVFEGNTFTALVETADPQYHAAAVTISGVDPGTGLVFRNNVMQSNDTGMQIGDDAYYRAFNEDVTFEASTILKLAEGDQSRTFVTILAGDQNSQCRNIRLLNTVFGEGVPTEPTFRGTGVKELTFLINTSKTVTQSGKLPPVVVSP